MITENIQVNEAIMGSNAIKRLTSIESKLSKFEKPSLMMQIANDISKQFAFNSRLRKFSIDVNYYEIPRNQPEYKDFYEIDNAISQIKSLNDGDLMQIANKYNQDIDTVSSTIKDYIGRLQELKGTLYNYDIKFINDVEKA